MSTPKKPGFVLSVIPFSGFYETLHDGEIERALEQCFSDSSGCNTNVNLYNRAFDLVQWHRVKIEYAKAYAIAFAEEFGLSGAEFESMTSPREYNFTTDRVFMFIPVSEVQRMHNETPRAVLDSVAREMFTSRSGFISFYSPDVDAWGKIETWDHNQVFALVSAFVLHSRNGEEFDHWAEYYNLCSDFNYNGWIDNWLFEHTSDNAALNRLANVAHYLRTREERAFKVGV